MAGDTIGVLHHQHGALAGSHVLAGLLDGLIDLQHIVAVDGAGGHVKGVGTLGDVSVLHGLSDGSGHAIGIVDTDEKCGQLPDGGQIHSFPSSTLVAGAVAEED